MNLFRYGLVSLLREYQFLLMDERKRGRYIQLMDNNQMINFSHVFMALGEDVQFSFRNAMRTCRTGGWARVPILVVRSGLELSRSTSFNPSMGSATVRCSFITLFVNDHPSPIWQCSIHAPLLNLFVPPPLRTQWGI